MTTNLEKVAVLSKFQCCYTELAGSVATKLGKYKMCDLKNEIRNMKLARAYILRIHNYRTLTATPSFAKLITFIRPSTDTVTVTVTINGTPYTLTNVVYDLDTIIANLTTLLEDASFLVTAYGDNGFIVYSYDTAFDDATVTSSITANNVNSTEVTDYVDEIVDLLLDGRNCLDREEICGIINQTCSILDKYCTT